MCTYPRASNGAEVPRRELRLLSWEYEDCSTLKREDMVEVDKLYRDHGWNDKYRAEGQYVDVRSLNRESGPYGKGESHGRADGAYRDYRKGESQYMDRRRVDRDCGDSRKVINQYRDEEDYGDHKKGVIRYMDYRRADEDYENYRKDDTKYMDRRRAAEAYRKTDSRYKEDEDYGGNRKGDIQYMDHRRPDGDRDRKAERQYREDVDGGCYWKLKGPNMGHGNLDQDSKFCRKPKSRVMDHRNLAGVGENCEVSETWSSGYGSTDLVPGSWSREPGVWDVEYSGFGEPEKVATKHRQLDLDHLGDGYSRKRMGHSDWSQLWEHEAEKASGTDSWQRNSCYRRTAPSALRHCEFVRTRKEKQGTKQNWLGISLGHCVRDFCTPHPNSRAASETSHLP